MTETFYEVLGVSTDASTAAIEAAYRERLKETHPDVSDAADAGEATQRLIEARDVLTDEDERARYDRVGHDAYVAGESDIADGGGSDAAEAARRAGYDGSASAGDRAEASTDRSTSRRAPGSGHAANGPPGTASQRTDTSARRTTPRRRRATANRAKRPARRRQRLSQIRAGNPEPPRPVASATTPAAVPPGVRRPRTLSARPTLPPADRFWRSQPAGG